MAKPKAKSQKTPAPEPQPKIELETASTEAATAEGIKTSSWLNPRTRLEKAATIAASIVFVGLLLVIGFDLLYSGKVYPGVTVDGAYLGGLTPAGAKTAINNRLDEFGRQVIPLNYGDSTIGLSASQISTQYDVDKAVNEAMAYGRRGNWFQRLGLQLQALSGVSKTMAFYSFDNSGLSSFITQIREDASQPVNNASFNFDGASARIVPSSDGVRLEFGLLTQAIRQRLDTTSAAPVAVRLYDIHPLISSDDLQSVQTQANNMVAGPLNLTASGHKFLVTQSDIVGWIQVTRPPLRDFLMTGDVADINHLPGVVSVGVDQAKLQAYVADLAKKIDQPGQDAALTIQDGKATVFRPSQDGYTLDQAAAVSQITDALGQGADQRQLTLNVKVKKPTVREDDLNDLGINELISEGFSTFPGSSAARLTNVRIGASKFNGALIAPDQVFSFGAVMGDVGPAQGYQPSLVIIGNKEEYQYGGGMCQVSSTMYRAALMAGLPIVQRTNHAFAVPFYTAPYGTPGVDATIYYPDVDLKFKNDTGHYILVQTIMDGTTLKFDFYGTKTKTGRIRGPYFVSGSLDATQPSHTVFYRDVLDLAGNVIKTDTVDTYYKSSSDFTIESSGQFH